MTEVTKLRVRVRVRAGVIASRELKRQLGIPVLFHLLTSMLVPCCFSIDIPRGGRPWAGQKFNILESPICIYCSSH